MEIIPEIGCTFHLACKVLICQSCCYGLHPEKNNTPPLNHFKCFHDTDRSFIQTVQKTYQRFYPTPPESIKNPAAFGPPIPDLDINYAWYCRRRIPFSESLPIEEATCDFISRSTNHFMRHQTACHPNNNNDDFLCQKVLVQTFFPNKYQSLFPVSDLTVFDHRPLIKTRPHWRVPIEKTIEPNSALLPIPNTRTMSSNSDAYNRTYITEGNSILSNIRSVL